MIHCLLTNDLKQKMLVLQLDVSSHPKREEFSHIIIDHLFRKGF